MRRQNKRATRQGSAQVDVYRLPAANLETRHNAKLSLARGLLAAAALAAFAPQAIATGSVADFYRGKQIELVIGYTPGGTYDLYARHDPAFIADAKRSHAFLNPVPGQDVQGLVGAIISTSPSVTSRLAAIFNEASNGSGK